MVNCRIFLFYTVICYRKEVSIGMQKQIIGKFYAASFDGKVFEFIVYNDNTMDCPTLNINSFVRIILKPRFILCGTDFYYELKTSSVIGDYNSPGLIETYDIDDNLFQYLKQRGMIKYSTDMAYLYDFSDKKGYDYSEFGVRSPYKWAKKKGPILTKQRQGRFN